MIHKIAESAFQTGYLSVESEGLLRQIVTSRGCRAEDYQILKRLQQAIRQGQIKREAKGDMPAFAEVSAAEVSAAEMNTDVNAEKVERENSSQ